MALTRQEKISIAAIFVGLTALTTTGCDRHDAERERAALHDAFTLMGVTDKEKRNEIFQSILHDTPCSETSDPEVCEQVKEFYDSKLGRWP